MSNFENCFVRGSSPSYSEDITSENGRMSTLPIGDRNCLNNNCKDRTISGSTTTRINKNYGQSQAIKGSTGNSFTNDRRTIYAFWTLVSLLFILTIGNLLLTITIIGVLRLGKGMESIELVPEEDTVKFFGITDLDRIYKRDGNIEGFIDEPVTIIGDGGSVQINVNRHGSMQSKMIMDKMGTVFKGVNTFEIKDSNSGEVIFSTHRPRYFISKSVGELNAKVMSSSRITSPIGKPLVFNADESISIRGSEGIFIDGRQIDLIPSEKGTIMVNTTQGSTILSGASGVFLDIGKVPRVSSEFGIRTGNIQYKICVCMPKGKLFRVPVPRNHSGRITCTHFNPKHDPCL